MKYTFEVS